MDYGEIGSLIVNIVSSSAPIGILFLLVEKLVQLFLSLVFPKRFSNF